MLLDLRSLWEGGAAPATPQPFLVSATGTRVLTWKTFRRAVLTATSSRKLQVTMPTRKLNWTTNPFKLTLVTSKRLFTWATQSRSLSWTLSSWINMSTLSTLPDTFELTTNETLIITVDMTNFMPTGQTIVTSPAPTATVTESGTGITIAGIVSALSRVDVSPGTSNGLQFTLTATTLKQNHKYTLRLGFQTNTGNILNTLTTLSILVT